MLPRLIARTQAVEGAVHGRGGSRAAPARDVVTGTRNATRQALHGAAHAQRLAGTWARIADRVAAAQAAQAHATWQASHHTASLNTIQHRVQDTRDSLASLNCAIAALEQAVADATEDLRVAALPVLPGQDGPPVLAAVRRAEEGSADAVAIAEQAAEGAAATQHRIQAMTASLTEAQRLTRQPALQQRLTRLRSTWASTRSALAQAERAVQGVCAPEDDAMQAGAVPQHEARAVRAVQAQDVAARQTLLRLQGDVDAVAQGAGAVRRGASALASREDVSRAAVQRARDVIARATAERQEAAQGGVQLRHARTQSEAAARHIDRTAQLLGRTEGGVASLRQAMCAASRDVASVSSSVLAMDAAGDSAVHPWTQRDGVGGAHVVWNGAECRWGLQWVAGREHWDGLWDTLAPPAAATVRVCLTRYGEHGVEVWGGAHATHATRIAAAHRARTGRGEAFLHAREPMWVRVVLRDGAAPPAHGACVATVTLCNAQWALAPAAE
jgi:hypothetical protein